MTIRHRCSHTGAGRAQPGGNCLSRIKAPAISPGTQEGFTLVESMMTRFAVRAPILAFAAWLCAAPSQADVKAGVDAWAQGDYSAAIGEWDKDAARGDADAQFNLAQAYKLGKGVPQDFAKAEMLFGKAAAQGHIQAADNGALLQFHRGDRTGALPHIQVAADRGDARAQYLLGIAHFNGDIARRDWVRAYALLTLARQAGLSQANSALVQMDAHIAVEQRQQAAALASQLGAQARSTRAQQLAAVDLAAGAPATMHRAPMPTTSLTIAEPAEATVTAQHLSGTESARAAGADFALPTPAAATAAAAAPITRKTPPSPASVTTKPATRPAVLAPPPDPWRVQLGAFGVRSNADALWNKVKNRPELSGHSRVNVTSRNITRLQAGGFASQAAAKSACSRLSAAGFSCLVTRN